MNLKTVITGALLALIVAACSSSGATTGPTSVPSAAPAASADGGSAMATDAIPMTVKDFTLDPKDVKVTGVGSLAVTNAGPTVHNVTIRDSAAKVLGGTKDLRTSESETLTVDLPAGSYVLFCSLPGHESLGIRGTLTVLK